MHWLLSGLCLLSSSWEHGPASCHPHGASSGSGDTSYACSVALDLVLNPVHVKSQKIRCWHLLLRYNQECKDLANTQMFSWGFKMVSKRFCWNWA